MRRQYFALLLGAAMTSPGAAASLTLAGLLDGDEGQAFDVDGRVSVTDSWSIGAGAGRGESDLAGEDFSATSLRFSTDLQIGGVFLSADTERWKDSGQLRSTTLRGELGWMSESGIAFSALVVDRGLDITYTATILGQTRDFDVALDGTGFGADISWFGARWSTGLRYVDYDYGSNLDRVRAIRDAASTGRFPRLQRLTTSVATRAAGAPDRELGVVVSRQFERRYLSGDWQMLRDALTGEKAHSLGLTLGVELGDHIVLDTLVGFTDGDTSGTVAWGGLALTLRTASSR